jgi:hypothetical protein
MGLGKGIIESFVTTITLPPSAGRVSVVAATIAFFGSDSRDLYKTDIFRALALPKGYVLQYRYQKKHIHQELVTNLAGMKGQAGQIIFVTGNDLSKAEADRMLAFHPIRQVTIKDVYIDPNIETVHFYLEMGDFTDSAHHANTAATHLPPQVFVTKITTQDNPAKSWIDRVKAIEAHFNKSLFFNVAAVRKGGKVLKPTYSTKERASRYSLNDEAGYQLDVSFFDPKAGQSGLTVENTSDDVVLSMPSNHRIGAEKDTTVFPLHTHTITKRQEIASSLLKERVAPPPAGGATAPSPAIPEFDVRLQWFVTRGSWKPWAFGGLSILAALSVAGAKVATDDLSKLQLGLANYIIGAVSLLGLGLAASLLFSLFNKK